jgi:hypothetical protein
MFKVGKIKKEISSSVSGRYGEDRGVSDVGSGYRLLPAKLLMATAEG